MAQTLEVQKVQKEGELHILPKARRRVLLKVRKEIKVRETQETPTIIPWGRTINSQFRAGLCETFSFTYPSPIRI